MLLSEILKNVELVDTISADVEIKNIQFDSRKVEVGSMLQHEVQPLMVMIIYQKPLKWVQLL